MFDEVYNNRVMARVHGLIVVCPNHWRRPKLVGLNCDVVLLLRLLDIENSVLALLRSGVTLQFWGYTWLYKIWPDSSFIF